jgi:hypothetical protein
MSAAALPLYEWIPLPPGMAINLYNGTSVWLRLLPLILFLVIWVGLPALYRLWGATMIDDTHIAGPRHSPVLAFLGGLIQPGLLLVGIVGGFTLSPWLSLPLAIIAGFALGRLRTYAVRSEIMRLSNAIGGLAGIAVTILLVFLYYPKWFAAIPDTPFWLMILPVVLFGIIAVATGPSAAEEQRFDTSEAATPDALDAPSQQDEQP